jgi:prepilin-type N-terminal cleavage/methylation domain-containing protein
VETDRLGFYAASRTGRFCTVSSGFSLMELLAAVFVLSILAGLTLPLAGYFRDRSETFRCRAKLRTLYNGTAAYVLDNQSWPSIRPSSKAEHTGGAEVRAGSSFDARWIRALEPYGVSQQDWVCPAAQRFRLRQIGEEQLKNLGMRIDYTPTIFGSGSMAPYEWPKHPWFIERGANHRSGQQIILSNGAVADIDELIQRETGLLR